MFLRKRRAVPGAQRCFCASAGRCPARSDVFAQAPGGARRAAMFLRKRRAVPGAQRCFPPEPYERVAAMANLPHIRLYRVGTAAALIAAPLLFLVDNLLHPKEVARGNELEQMRLIADAYTRWQAAHAIGFVAILAFAPAVLGLTFLVRWRRRSCG